MTKAPMNIDLFDQKDNIQLAFERFDADNPRVYELIKKIAFELKDMGFHSFGIGAIYEQLRWRMMLETTDPDFKLNNNYRSRYVRKLIADYPQFKNFFQLRELRST